MWYISWKCGSPVGGGGRNIVESLTDFIAALHGVALTHLVRKHFLAVPTIPFAAFLSRLDISFKITDFWQALSIRHSQAAVSYEA